MRAADSSRTRLVLRLIAIERTLRGLLLLAAGVYLLFHLSTDFGRLAERVIRSIDIDPRQTFFNRIVARHATLWKAGGIVVNILIVMYLVWGLRRRLARGVEWR